jgi:hypothetical protein
LSGAHVHDAVTKDSTGELGGSRDRERLDHLQDSILRNSVVDSEVLALNISVPEKTSARLAVERGHGSVADTEDISVVGRRVGNLCKPRNAIVALKFENMGGILDD